MEYLTAEQVKDLAIERHWGQLDKLGKPYYLHLQAVAESLKEDKWGRGLVQAGWLHDILEDTDTTAEELLTLGVQPRIVTIVEAVTKPKGANYTTYLRDIASYGGQAAVLVKIADNAHNSQPERAAQLDEETRTRLAKRYADAREILWPSLDPDEIYPVLERLNPALYRELEQLPKTEYGMLPFKELPR